MRETQQPSQFHIGRAEPAAQLFDESLIDELEKEGF